MRVVAATNKDLLATVEAGAFREDLYHRLAVILIHVPPLRERRADVPTIAAHIADASGAATGARRRPSRRRRAGPRCSRLDWRGNVRELHNVVERLLILSEGDDDDRARRRALRRGRAASAAARRRACWSSTTTSPPTATAPSSCSCSYQLEHHGWNVSRTAETIGIQRSHLYNMMGKFEIERAGEG